MNPINEIHVVNQVKTKTIVITGAASGIGKCCASVLSQQQATLLLIDIQKDALEATKKELCQGQTTQEAMDRISILCADLSCQKDCAKVEAKIAGYDCVDGLIHCAGLMGEYGRCHETSLAHFDLIMKHQCYSAFHAAHCVLPKFCEKRGGSIVMVGGVGGLVALPHLSAYTTALHGVSGLVRSLALDYGKDKIRVNGVMPAATHTPMYKKAQGNHPSLSRTGSLMKSAVPLQKIASAKEVTDVILFLLGDEASHVSGALIPVDGGFTTY